MIRGSEERGDMDGEGTERARGDADLVVLTTVFNPMEAEIIAAKLRSASIDCMIKHDALSVVYGLTVDGAGRQDILVRAADAAQAREALAVAEDRSVEWTDDHDDGEA